MRTLNYMKENLFTKAKSFILFYLNLLFSTKLKELLSNATHKLKPFDLFIKIFVIYY